jgi:hypothetical protein
MFRSLLSAAAAASLAFAALAAHAQPVAQPSALPGAQAQILSISNFDVGGQTVQLATTRSAKGDICVGYVESVTRGPMGTLSVTTGAFCGKGSKEIPAYPSNLAALRTFERGGVRWQAPDARVAAVADSAKPEVLSIENFDVGGTTVELPTTRAADGTVCVSYVSRVDRNAEGAVTLTTDALCGKSKKDEPAVPGNMAALRVIERDGLRWQEPVSRG